MLDLKALDTRAAGPRGVLRVLQVLEVLAGHPQGRTLAQLCSDLKLPKTTLYTMVKTLLGHGYLRTEDGTYRLGAPALALGAAMSASGQRNFPECARAALEGLCRRTGETAFLAVLTPDAMHCRYVAVVESGNSLRFSVQPDSLRPAWATGTGQAMLACLPREELEAVVARVAFEKITPTTLASKRALMAQLARVRREHVSVTDGGTVAGVVSVAAPIFDRGGRVAAAVSAGGPTVRLGPQLGAITRSVRLTAEDISRTLGYGGDWPPA